MAENGNFIMNALRNVGGRFRDRFQNFRDHPIQSLISTGANMALPGAGIGIDALFQNRNNSRTNDRLEDMIGQSNQGLSDQIWGTSSAPNGPTQGSALTQMFNAGQNPHTGIPMQNWGSAPSNISQYEQSGGNVVPNYGQNQNTNTQSGMPGITSSNTFGGSSGNHGWSGPTAVSSSAQYESLLNSIGLNEGFGYQGTPANAMNGSEMREMRLANGRPNESAKNQMLQFLQSGRN